ncbi:CMP-N-acetylneuraminate-beta-1,4-galactoside alpha-2,3-sialyltransferase-like [Saccoglossus kowalevskii]
MVVCPPVLFCVVYVFNSAMFRPNIEPTLSIYSVVEEFTKLATQVNVTDLELELNFTSCTKGFLKKAIKKYVYSFDPNIPLFLTSNFKEWTDYARMKTSSEPFGFKNHEDVVERVLKLLPEANKTTPIGLTDHGDCKRCILVASSGVSTGKGLGKLIDKYDVVIRMNNAPVKKYEKDVGSKTTFRLVYPESAFRTSSSYDKNSVLVFVPYKLDDYLWLEAVIKGDDPIKKGLKFWKKSATSLNKPADKIQILNPYLGHEVANYHMKTKKRPSTGAMAVVMALHYCDHLHITGYGYHPNVTIHYYEKSKGIPRDGAHSWFNENRYIMKLLYCGVIEKDLTGLYEAEVRIRGSELFNCSEPLSTE